MKYIFTYDSRHPRRPGKIRILIQEFRPFSLFQTIQKICKLLQPPNKHVCLDFAGKHHFSAASNITGRPFFEFPMTIILLFGDSANFCVASIPFQVRSDGVTPEATIF